jgi:hypothetical protein
MAGSLMTFCAIQKGAWQERLSSLQRQHYGIDVLSSKWK